MQRQRQTQHSNHRDGDREHSKSFYDEPSPLPTEGKKERNKKQKNTMHTMHRANTDLSDKDTQRLQMKTIKIAIFFMYIQINLISYSAVAVSVRPRFACLANAASTSITTS